MDSLEAHDAGVRAAAETAVPGLDVSIVVFHPDGRVLVEALDSIVAALPAFAAAGGGPVRLWIIDNAERSEEEALRALLERSAAARELPATLLSGHGNVGYGAGHNLAIRQGTAAYHLVLNHDILLDPAALAEGLRFMAAHPDVVLLSPRVLNEGGEQEFLCKRTPTLLDLLLRGFAPRPVRALFAGRLARYEMRDVIGAEPVFGLEHVGGAFMLFRRDALAALGGFDERFFLYFEDFDLSKRAAALGTVAYVPAVSIVHYGGKAASKGMRHVRLFAGSALRWFAKHGWRLL